MGTDTSALTVDTSGSPTGGVYRLSWRHATSAQIPYDADKPTQDAATAEMQELDEQITAAHAADPEAFKACNVCNPDWTYPKRYRPTWREEVRDRVRGAWNILRHGGDHYSEF